MVKIDCLIFGYRRVKVDPEKIGLLTSRLLKYSIPSEVKPDGTVIIKERDFNKFKRIIQSRIEFESYGPYGLYGKYKQLKYKAVYISALLFSLLLMIFLISV